MAQICVPIFGLMCMSFLRDAILSNSDMLANKDFNQPIPYIYNIPLAPLAKLGQFFNVSECDEWYMYQFDENTKPEDKEYFGYNEGLPWLRP